MAKKPEKPSEPQTAPEDLHADGKPLRSIARVKAYHDDPEDEGKRALALGTLQRTGPLVIVEGGQCWQYRAAGAEIRRVELKLKKKRSAADADGDEARPADVGAE